MKTLQKIWEYFFAPWEIEIVDRGTENWDSTPMHNGICIESLKHHYKRDFVEYKYNHKFRKEEKIVKEYLN